MHDLDSIFRVCSIMERIGVIGAYLTPRTLEKDMKKILENQFAKSLNGRDLIEFFDLICSIHKHRPKPKADGHAAAQKKPLPILKFLSKTSKLKTPLEVDSRHEVHSNSFLKAY